MGLPLFIEYEEPGFKSRSSEKISSLRPTRSSIRHSRRSDVARAVRRRAAILRETFTSTTHEQPDTSQLPQDWEDSGYPPPSDQPARYPWIETGQLPPPEAYNPPSAPPPLPEWLTERLERHDATDHRPRMSTDEDAIVGLLGSRYMIGSRRSNSTSPAPAGELPTQVSRVRTRNISQVPRRDVYHRDQIPPSVAARFDRSPDRDPSGQAAAESTVRFLPTGPTREEAASGEHRAWRRVPSSFGVDGLGDRTRSMSPEVWDTLLSTLTPDPQPPSVGSSFASAPASNSAATSQRQSAAASSRTSFAEPGFSNEATTEHPCESGHEDSEGDDEQPRVAARPARPSTNYPSRHRRFVSALNSNDHSSTSHVRADRPGARSTLPDRIMYAHGHIRSHLLSYGPLFSDGAPMQEGLARGSGPRVGTASTEEPQDNQPDPSQDQTRSNGAPNVDEIAWAILRSLADNDETNE